MENQNLSRRLVKIKILELIQCLYQNHEIDNVAKNNIAMLLRQDRYEDLKGIFKSLLYGTTLPDVVEECILLTKQGGENN